MRVLVAIVSAIALATVIGCSKQEEEGKAETMGKQIDEKVEKASEYAGEKVEEAGKAVEQAGEDMKK